MAALSWVAESPTDWANLLNGFPRIDRLRILCGARWCFCDTCQGIVQYLSYRTLATLSGMNYAAIQRFNESDAKMVQVSKESIVSMSQKTGLAVEQIVPLLQPIKIVS